MKPRRLSAETPLTRLGRIRPIPRPFFLRRDHDDGLFLDLATPLALFNASNACFAGLDLASKRRSRPGRTIALRSLCIHVQAVSKLPRPKTRGKPRAPAPFF